jgi:hypothetical protein
MKGIETGIYPTHIPENDAELSRHYDLGIQKPATIIAGYEQRAIAVLLRHKLIDETFLCDQSPIEPPARKFAGDRLPARKQLVQKREDGTYEPAKAPAVYRVEHPENLKVPLVPPGIEPNTDLEKEQQRAEHQQTLAVVLDARSLLMQIEVYRHTEQALSRGLRDLAAPGGSPDSAVTPEQRKANLLDDVRHRTEMLVAYAMKIGELADRLFNGRPKEEPVRFANDKRAEFAESGKESAKARLKSLEKLDEATEAEIISAARDYPGESPNYLTYRVLERMDESLTVKTILADMDSQDPNTEHSLPSPRKVWQKIKDLRAAKIIL